MTPPRGSLESRASRRVVGARVAALFDEHASMVFGLCRLLLRDHHEAEDASQQTFVSAYRALLRGTEPREPGPWLAAIARNECRARLRKRARAPISLEDGLEVSDGPDLADVADAHAEFDLLTDEIAKLPSRQREAIALRDFLGLSYEEVASALSVSVPVVESLLFRARRRLRDTVRTVPRYAAGIVMVPVALRAAVAREIPELDTATAISGGAAAGIGAAGLAKLLSMPFTVKAAATTAALVAAGSVVAPQFLHHPDSSPNAAPRMTALEQVERAGIASPAGGVAAGATPSTASDARDAESAVTAPAASDASPAEASSSSAGTEAPPGEPSEVPDRVSTSTGVPPTDPPQLPPADPEQPAACDGPSASSPEESAPCETPAETPAQAEQPGSELEPPAVGSSALTLEEIWHILGAGPDEDDEPEEDDARAEDEAQAGTDDQGEHEREVRGS